VFLEYNSGFAILGHAKGEVPGDLFAVFFAVLGVGLGVRFHF
jgi:hypothetical protein